MILPGIVLIVFGVVYLARPDLYRRGLWLRTSIAIRLLSETNYRRYMRGLGVVMIVAGVFWIASPPRSIFSDDRVRRFADAGPETWTVDGHAYQLSGTHYEQVAGRGAFYVMTYPVPSETSANIATADDAAPQALPLIRYAHDHDTASRVHIPPDRRSAAPPVNLAVDLVSPDDGHLLYRYEVPAGEVTWRLAHPAEK